MSLFSSIFGFGKSDKPSPQSSAPYNFSTPEDTACFTCKQVVHEGAEILYVTHDSDDGGWQFLSGGDLCEEDAMIVSIRQIVEIDPSVNALYEMPEGVGAVRDSVDSEWKPFRLS